MSESGYENEYEPDGVTIVINENNELSVNNGTYASIDHNHEIDALNATTPLSAAKGGTGVASLQALRAALGTLFNTVIQKNESFTITDQQDGILFDVTTGTNAIVATLPNATLVRVGFSVAIRKEDAAAGTIATSPATQTISNQSHVIKITSDGTEWDITEYDLVLPVSILNGGTGQTTAPLALAALGGEPVNGNIQSHIASTANPHATTAVQVLSLFHTIIAQSVNFVINQSSGHMFNITTGSSTITAGLPPTPNNNDLYGFQKVDDGTGKVTLTGTAYELTKKDELLVLYYELATYTWKPLLWVNRAPCATATTPVDAREKLKALFSLFKDKDADFTATATDDGVLFNIDCTENDVTATLPNATTCAGCRLGFKKTDNTDYVVYVNDWYLSKANEIIWIYSNGVVWSIGLRTIAVPLSLDLGGTGSVMAITGGTGHVVKQASEGAPLTTGRLDEKMTEGYLINGRQSQFWLTDPATLTARANDTYGPEGWINLSQNDTVEIQRIDSDDTGTDNRSRYALRIKQNQATAQRFGIMQIVEGINCRDLRGRTIELQCRVRCSINQPIRAAIMQWTGTENAVLSSCVNNWESTDYTDGASKFFVDTNIVPLVSGNTGVENTTTWRSLVVTGTVAETMNNLMVMIWTEGTLAQNGTLDIGMVDICKESVAQMLPREDLQRDISRCMRYAEKSYAPDTVPGTAVATHIVIPNVATWTQGSTYYTCNPVWFKEVKFTTPTITIYNPVTGVASSFRTGGANNITGDAMANNRTQYGFNSYLSNISAQITAGQTTEFHFMAQCRL